MARWATIFLVVMKFEITLSWKGDNMEIGEMWEFEYKLPNKTLKGNAKVVQVFGLNGGRLKAKDDEYEFEMVGNFEGILFKGEWYNTDESDYYGMFMFIVADDGQSMDGKFLGTTHDDTISEGTWTMRKIT